MARLTISLPDHLATAAARRAETERRSASAYVAILIEQDLIAHGALASGSSEHAERLAKVEAALAAHPENAPSLDRFVARLTRRSRVPAASATAA